MAAPTLPDDLRTRPAVAAAIADTAQREKVDPTQVVIAAWSPVTWNDGSLGCPKKGKGYTQALVEGELLLLQTETGLFQYNAPRRRPVRLLRDPVARTTPSAAETAPARERTGPTHTWPGHGRFWARRPAARR